MINHVDPQLLLDYANCHVIFFGHSKIVDHLRSAALEIDKLREENQKVLLAMIEAQSLINDGTRYRMLKDK